MKRIASSIAAAVVLFAAGISVSPPVHAQGTYPNKPIRWIVPYAAGGGADVIARPISVKLSEVLGQPILYDNRGGGGGLIGAEAVARSAPDGYTFLVAAGNTNVFAALLNEKIAYDQVKDFQPITQFDTTPNVLISNPNFSPKNMKELIAYARANPGKINWGHSGAGSGGHLSILQLMGEHGIKVLPIAYKGAGPAVTATLSGENDLMFINPGVVIANIKAGKLRPLGFAGAKRLPTLADVPTIDEQGFPGFDSSNFKGLMAPAGTPRPIVNRVHGELVKIVHSPDNVARMLAAGSLPVGNTPEQFAEMLRLEIAKWGKIIKDNNIKAE